MRHEDKHQVWVIGPYEISWLKDQKAWIHKDGGEGMETDQLKLAYALVKALDEFWRKEF